MNSQEILVVGVQYGGQSWNTQLSQAVRHTRIMADPAAQLLGFKSQLLSQLAVLTLGKLLNLSVLHIFTESNNIGQ